MDAVFDSAEPPIGIPQPLPSEIAMALQLIEGGGDGIHAVFADTGKPFGDVVPGFRQRKHEGHEALSKCLEDTFTPTRKMTKSLCELTGKPAYKYRAFELLVTLDLDIYKATRRLIVAADIDFQRLHLVLQQAFGWRNYHLYDFTVWDETANHVPGLSRIKKAFHVTMTPY